MSAKRIENVLTGELRIPEDVKELTYFKRLGYELDEEQWALVEAIWNKKNIGVMVNAKAGTGKTTLAVGMAMLMAQQFRMYNRIYYVISPCEEDKLGYAPGTIEEKTAMYMEPLRQALLTWGYNPDNLIETKDNYKAVKEGTAIIKAIPHTFLRGQDLSKSFIICEESQNYKLHDLKKTLSRAHDDCKVVVIGHTGQIDLKYPQDSGFDKYLNAADRVDFIETVELTKNYRGKFSNWADEVK